MIQLNEHEQKLYKDGGCEYLNKLAHDIHYSVPIAKDISSILRIEFRRQFTYLWALAQALSFLIFCR